MSVSSPPAPSRILVVEDEPAIADIIATAVRHQGHTVVIADHGEQGLERAVDDVFDLLILDVMLPGLDGFEICAALRRDGHNVPVLFLTARDDIDDRLRGLSLGADDYLSKPFSVDELVLRVAAILRRTGQAAPPHLLVVADLSLDPEGRTVNRGGESIELSKTEFDLLEYLMINRGVVVSKAQILANVWDDDFDGTENVVELYVGYLRRKLDGGAPLIHTKRGAGYVLREGDR